MYNKGSNWSGGAFFGLSTGAYHIPILTFLIDQGIFVSVINPLVMKEYRCKGLRKAKTDRLDSRMIANYGLDNWFHLKAYSPDTETYRALKLLGRQYAHYMRMRIGKYAGTD